MQRRALTAPLALLFISSFVLCNAQKSGAVAGAGGGGGAGDAEVVVVVTEGAPLEVECALRMEQSAAWRVDEHKLQPAHGLRVAGERAAGSGVVLARLVAPRAHLDHTGRYTCAPDSRAVHVRVLPAHAAAAGAAPLPSSPPPVRAGEEPGVIMVEIRKPFALACDLPNPSALPVAWTVNGTALEERADLAARFAREEGGARLAVRYFHEDDYGNYTCGVGGAQLAWDVRGVPVARAPLDAAVVEGQKLRLACRITGKPYPAVSWLYGNDSGPATDALEVFGARASLARSEQGVEGGELWLEAAQRSDAGQYWCVAGAGGHNATTTVRVKDMYAALWPFLGICLEVFLLCAIILIYEKRRTKPELDDSDTDNHDQKKS